MLERSISSVSVPSPPSKGPLLGWVIVSLPGPASTEFRVPSILSSPSPPKTTFASEMTSSPSSPCTVSLRSASITSPKKEPTMSSVPLPPSRCTVVRAGKSAGWSWLMSMMSVPPLPTTSMLVVALHRLRSDAAYRTRPSTHVTVIVSPSSSLVRLTLSSFNVGVTTADEGGAARISATHNTPASWAAWRSRVGAAPATTWQARPDRRTRSLTAGPWSTARSRAARGPRAPRRRLQGWRRQQQARRAGWAPRPGPPSRSSCRSRRCG